MAPKFLGTLTGVEPDLTAKSTIAVLWVQFAVTLVFVIFRAWIQFVLQGSLKIDDYFVFFALTCHFIMCVLLAIAIPRVFDLFHHLDYKIRPTPEFLAQQNEFLRLQFAMILFFWTILWAVKASFMAFYKGIFGDKFYGWQRTAWWVTMVFCVISYLGCWITQFLSCSPLQNYFQLGKCQSPTDIRNSNISLYYSTAADIVSDLLIMVLPLSLLPKLFLDRRKKIALALLFSSGFVIILFAILRLVLTLPGTKHVNPKWLAIMSVTESSIAIIVSTAPPFRKLLTQRQRDRATLLACGGGNQQLHSDESGASLNRPTGLIGNTGLYRANSAQVYDLARTETLQPPPYTWSNNKPNSVGKNHSSWPSIRERYSTAEEKLEREREKERVKARKRYHDRIRLADLEMTVLPQAMTPYHSRHSSSSFDFWV